MSDLKINRLIDCDEISSDLYNEILPYLGFDTHPYSDSKFMARFSYYHLVSKMPVPVKTANDRENSDGRKYKLSYEEFVNNPLNIEKLKYIFVSFFFCRDSLIKNKYTTDKIAYMPEGHNIIKNFNQDPMKKELFPNLPEHMSNAIGILNRVPLNTLVEKFIKEEL